MERIIEKEHRTPIDGSKTSPIQQVNDHGTTKANPPSSNEAFRKVSQVGIRDDLSTQDSQPVPANGIRR